MPDRHLLFRAAARLHALRVDSVHEVLRPLKIEPVSDAPPFVLGVGMIRGRATPVLSAEILLTGASLGLVARRWIHLRMQPADGATDGGGRPVALAVEEVLGVREGRALKLEACAPLLRDADAGMIEQFGRLDGELLRQLGRGVRLPELALASHEGPQA